MRSGATVSTCGGIDTANGRELASKAASNGFTSAGDSRALACCASAGCDHAQTTREADNSRRKRESARDVKARDMDDLRPELHGSGRLRVSANARLWPLDDRRPRKH